MPCCFPLIYDIRFKNLVKSLPNLVIISDWLNTELNQEHSLDESDNLTKKSRNTTPSVEEQTEKGQESQDEQGAKTEEDQQEDQEPDDDQSQDYQDDQDGQESQIKQDVTGNKEVEKNLDRTQKSLDILGESGEHWALTGLDFLDTENTDAHTSMTNQASTALSL